MSSLLALLTALAAKAINRAEAPAPEPVAAPPVPPVPAAPPPRAEMPVFTPLPEFSGWALDARPVIWSLEHRPEEWNELDDRHVQHRPSGHYLQRYPTGWYMYDDKCNCSARQWQEGQQTSVNDAVQAFHFRTHFAT